MATRLLELVLNGLLHAKQILGSEFGLWNSEDKKAGTSAPTEASAKLQSISCFPPAQSQQFLRVCIADETPEPGSVGQPADERPLDLLLLRDAALRLTVVGKALNLRAERRFGEAWRQSAAQAGLRSNSGEWRRRRAREMRLKMAASRLWQARMRGYLRLAFLVNGQWTTLRLPGVVWRCSMLLNEIKRREMARMKKARRREAAKRLQCCWRGLLGRRAAFARQKLLAARRLQRCWRGWRSRRRLCAVKRLAHWWRQLLAVRASAALRLQAWLRGQIARTCARQLRRIRG
ncbi:TTLL3E [Symbiodinium sp. CCMP2592]|nr:TTLL3E [Symbiodinium sp. CCMP2592]